MGNYDYVIDFRPLRGPRPDPCTAPGQTLNQLQLLAADAEALAGDWAAAGADLYAAMGMRTFGARPGVVWSW